MYRAFYLQKKYPPTPPAKADLLLVPPERRLFRLLPKACLTSSSKFSGSLHLLVRADLLLWSFFEKPFTYQDLFWAPLVFNPGQRLTSVPFLQLHVVLLVRWSGQRFEANITCRGTIGPASYQQQAARCRVGKTQFEKTAKSKKIQVFACWVWGEW